MICFDFFFIRLSRSHESKIVLNELTRVDLTYFLCYFLIKFFYKFHHSTLGLTWMFEN
jgi:hypothetical protein